MTNILKLLPPNNRCVDIPCWNIELARVTGNILQLKCLSSPSWGGNSHFASEVTQPPIFDQKRGHPLGSGVTWWLTCFTFGCSYVVLLYKYTNLKDTAGHSAIGHPREKQWFYLLTYSWFDQKRGHFWLQGWPIYLFLTTRKSLKCPTYSSI